APPETVPQWRSFRSLPVRPGPRRLERAAPSKPEAQRVRRLCLRTGALGARDVSGHDSWGVAPQQRREPYESKEVPAWYFNEVPFHRIVTQWRQKMRENRFGIRRNRRISSSPWEVESRNGQGRLKSTVGEGRRGESLHFILDRLERRSESWQ